MNEDMVSYYRDRAKEYERIYFKPERQEDIQSANKILKGLFSDKNVFEVARGTGFWTQFFAPSAKSVLATDINASVIEIAKSKNVSNVIFEVQDLYSYSVTKNFDALFAGFIYSHVLRQELDTFLDTLNKTVTKSGQVVIMDNLYVEGSNHPITHTDEHGNTYQTRKLDDGSTHKVLKNFPTKEYLEEKLKGKAIDVKVIFLTYFWILSYKSV